MIEFIDHEAASENFTRLDNKLRRRVMTRATAAGARIITKHIRRNAPYDPNRSPNKPGKHIRRSIRRKSLRGSHHFRGHRIFITQDGFHAQFITRSGRHQDFFQRLYIEARAEAEEKLKEEFIRQMGI